MADVDPVGAGGHLERSRRCIELQLSTDFALQDVNVSAPLVLGACEPVGKARKAWTPEWRIFKIEAEFLCRLVQAFARGPRPAFGGRGPG